MGNTVPETGWKSPEDTVCSPCPLNFSLKDKDIYLKKKPGFLFCLSFIQKKKNCRLSCFVLCHHVKNHCQLSVLLFYTIFPHVLLQVDTWCQYPCVLFRCQHFTQKFAVCSYIQEEMCHHFCSSVGGFCQK